jgi:hypothetical protein
MFASFLDQSFFYLLLVVYASVISVFLLTRVRRLQQAISDLENRNRGELDRVLKNLTQQRARLQMAEQCLARISQKQDELKANEALDTNLSHASKLLSLGIEEQQLVHDFGLSEAEASLMSLVHNSPVRIEEPA